MLDLSSYLTENVISASITFVSRYLSITRQLIFHLLILHHIQRTYHLAISLITHLLIVIIVR